MAYPHPVFLDEAQRARLRALDRRDCLNLADIRQVYDPGKLCNEFCYPFGSCDDRAEAVVMRAGFRLACTIETGLNDGQRFRWRLKMVAVERHDTGHGLIAKVKAL